MRTKMMLCVKKRGGDLRASSGFGILAQLASEGDDEPRHPSCGEESRQKHRLALLLMRLQACDNLARGANADLKTVLELWCGWVE